MVWDRAKALEAERRYRAKHPDRVREKNRRWRQENPAKHCAEVKLYYKRHTEKVSARQKRYRVENREKVNAANRKWRASHVKQENARIAGWAKTHPEHRAISRGHRRAMKRGNGGAHTVVQWKQLCWASSWQCSYCATVLDARTAHRDHKIPIFRGGSDNIENIAVSCRSCNARKHTMTNEEFDERMAVTHAVAGG